MVLIDLMQYETALLLGVVGIFGLIVGSFLNVVIYRLPRMMEQQWRYECQAFLDQAEESPPAAKTAFNLVIPGSHCPACRQPVHPLHNIPLLSFLVLRGRCAYCQAPISYCYPLVEAVSALLSVLVAWHYGWGWALLFALVLTWALLSLAVIDLQHQLLPDSITQPLLWLGLLLSLNNVFVDTRSAIIGAVAGYLSLWLVYHLFKLVTGKEGMGYGDFKLLALLGAWVGWKMLPTIILLSSAVGAIVGVTAIVLGRHQRAAPMPFGPFLAAAGWLALLWGDFIDVFS